MQEESGSSQPQLLHFPGKPFERDASSQKGPVGSYSVMHSLTQLQRGSILEANTCLCAWCAVGSHSAAEGCDIDTPRQCSAEADRRRSMEPGTYLSVTNSVSVVTEFQAQGSQ